MRILASSLIFIIIGCNSYPKQNGFNATEATAEAIINPYFSDTSKDYIYKARIEAFDNKFSGLLAIKKLSENQHRLAFTTEMGNTIFDFTFKGETFTVNRILDKLDRKIIINILKRDFFALLSQPKEIEETFTKGSKTLHYGVILGKKHYYLVENNVLKKITRTGATKEKVIIEFNDVSDNTSKKVYIKHKNINLNIQLNAL